MTQVYRGHLEHQEVKAILVSRDHLETVDLLEQQDFQDFKEILDL